MKRSLLFALPAILCSLPGLAQSEEPIQFNAGPVTIYGTLTLPANGKPPVPVLLLIAGSGPTDRDGNSPMPLGNLGTLKAASYRLLSDSLVRRGIAVVRYDKRGAGKSVDLLSGEKNLRFDTYIADAAGFITQLKADKRFSQVVVGGHSEGSLVGMVATQRAGADAFISIAGPGDAIADKLKAQLGPQLTGDDRQQTFAAIDSLNAGFTLTRLPTTIPAVQQLFRPSVQPYMISWMKYNPASQIKSLTVPVLIIQGKRDLQVTVSDAEKLKAARPNDRLIFFDQMTHTLKDVPTTDQLANLKTYVTPDLPLSPGLATAIAQFMKP
jgi:hypothetical protein